MFFIFFADATSLPIQLSSWEALADMPFDILAPLARTPSELAEKLVVTGATLVVTRSYQKNGMGNLRIPSLFVIFVD